jgi:hypothetical protein
MWPEYAATLSAESGIDVGYLRCGAIDIRERTIRNPQRELRKLRDSGGRVEVLTRDQIRQLLPDLVRSPEAGLLVEMEARIDPLATIEALRRSCHGAGVNIRENLGPIRIEPIGAGGITLVATAGIELFQPSEQRSVILAAVMSAIFWDVVTWYFGIPSSSSHALVGGLIGAAILSEGISVVRWSGLLKILLALTISPPLGLLAGYLNIRDLLGYDKLVLPLKTLDVLKAHLG